MQVLAKTKKKKKQPNKYGHFFFGVFFFLGLSWKYSEGIKKIKVTATKKYKSTSLYQVQNHSIIGIINLSLCYVMECLN